MDLLADMENYFKGERDLALVMIPFGLAVLSLAYYLWLHYKGSFGQAFMFTSLLVGLGLLVAGSVMMLKGGMDINKNIALIKLDSAGFITAELERVSHMNKALWPALKVLWAVIVLVSIGVIFFINHEIVRGITLALFLAAAIFMVVDILAEKRAIIYEGKLRLVHQSL